MSVASVLEDPTARWAPRFRLRVHQGRSTTLLDSRPRRSAFSAHQASTARRQAWFCPQETALPGTTALVELVFPLKSQLLLVTSVATEPSTPRRVLLGSLTCSTSRNSASCAPPVSSVALLALCDRQFARQEATAHRLQRCRSDVHQAHSVSWTVSSPSTSASLVQQVTIVTRLD